MKTFILSAFMLLGLSMAASACEMYEIEVPLTTCVDLSPFGTWCYTTSVCIPNSGPNPLLSKTFSVAPWATKSKASSTATIDTKQVDIKQPEKTVAVSKSEATNSSL